MSGSTTGLRARSIVAPLLHFLVLLRDLLLTLPVVLLALPLWALPWPLATRLGRFYGRVAWLGWPLARRVAMINLRRAFGLERAAARRFTLEVFTHLGQSIADGLQAARRGGAALDALYRLEDPELVARVLAVPAGLEGAALEPYRAALESALAALTAEVDRHAGRGGSVPRA